MLIRRKISLDYLRNKPNIKLYQNLRFFKINSDTCNLGESYYNNNPEALVLDIGTNNGALLLYAALFPYKKLVGIDINKKGLKIAKKNLKMNKIKNFELIYGNFLDYNFLIKFDKILINPPYFTNQLQSNNKFLMNAKHDNLLPLDLLINKCSKILKDNGSIFIVHRVENLSLLNNEIKKNNLYFKEIKNYNKTFIAEIKRVVE